MDSAKLPGFEKDAFICPFCGVYAHQKWYSCYPENLIRTSNPLWDYDKGSSRLCISVCSHCNRASIWFDEKKIFPLSSSAPLPSPDMPEEIKKDYMEARNIVDLSPRSAAALLRLALEKLIVELGESGKDLNEGIGNLVKKRGLPVKIQQALDAVRLIGNNAVHPGKLDLRDDKETAYILFELLNMIIDTMITKPKKVDKIYQKLPEQRRRAIEKRDSNKQ